MRRTRDRPAPSIRTIGVFVSILVGVVTISSRVARSDDSTTDDAWAGIEEMVVIGVRTMAPIEVSDSALEFSGLELEAANVADISDLADFTPNLEIKTGASSVSNPTIFIRGIGLADFNSNAASSVAVYNDGVYMNSPIGQLFQLFDTEAVAVLRGPQGVRNARNATAGALIVEARKPGRNGEFEERASLTYGNYDFVEFTGALGFPIVPGTVESRFSGRLARRDGYLTNRCSVNPNNVLGAPIFSPAGQCRRLASDPPVAAGLKKNVGSIDDWAARSIFRVNPTDDQEWLFNVHGGQSRGDAFQFQSRGVLGVFDGAGRDRRGYRDADRDAYAGDYDLVEPEKIDLLGANVTASFSPGGVHIESISAYEGAWRDVERNIDGGPRPTASNRLKNKVWQLSQSIEIESAESGGFEWYVGAFALYESLEQDQTIFTKLTPSGFDQDQSFEQKTWTWAIYAGGTFDLTDWLHVGGGIRYNWERKDFSIYAAPRIPDEFDASAFPPSLNSLESNVWQEPSGELILTFDVTDEASLYAKYTRGFKGGHVNGGAILSGQLIDAVDPESNDSLEVGLKSVWLDGEITLNAAFFYYFYKNYQVFAVQNTPGAFPLPQLLNASEVETRGIEVDLKTRLVPGLQFDLSFAILDAIFEDFEVSRSFRPLNCPGDPNPNFCEARFEQLEFSGNPVVAAPPYSITAVLAYEIPLGRFGTLKPHVDVSYRGKTYFTPGRQVLSATGARAQKDEAASQASYGLVNLRLGYTTPSGEIELAGWVRNVTNEVYLINSLDVTSALGSYLDIHGQPRTYGVTLSLNY